MCMLLAKHYVAWLQSNKIEVSVNILNMNLQIELSKQTLCGVLIWHREHLLLSCCLCLKCP